MQFGFSGKNRNVIAPGWVTIVAAAFALTAGPSFADPGPSNDPNPTSAQSLAPVEPSNQTGIELGIGSADQSGDFGAPKTTNVAAVLATATYRIDGLRLTASLPWMRIDGSSAVFTGIEGAPIVADPSSLGVHKLRQGIGDLTLGASYLLPSNLSYGLDADLTVRVKVPTASSDTGLSTGEVDYAVGGTVSKTIGSFAPLVSVFYRSFGDGPRFQLKNGFATSLGVTYAVSERTVALLTYDYAQRASQYISDSHQISFSLSTLLPKSPLRLTSFIAGGLSRGAPAISAGLSFSVRL